jgi:hypothetical protein
VESLNGFGWFSRHSLRATVLLLAAAVVVHGLLVVSASWVSARRLP